MNSAYPAPQVSARRSHLTRRCSDHIEIILRLLRPAFLNESRLVEQDVTHAIDEVAALVLRLLRSVFVSYSSLPLPIAERLQLVDKLIVVPATTHDRQPRPHDLFVADHVAGR